MLSLVHLSLILIGLNFHLLMSFFLIKILSCHCWKIFLPPIYILFTFYYFLVNLSLSLFILERNFFLANFICIISHCFKKCLCKFVFKIFIISSSSHHLIQKVFLLDIAICINYRMITHFKIIENFFT